MVTRDLVLRLPVCLRCSADRLVRVLLYWLYLDRTSLSRDVISCRNRQRGGSEVDGLKM